VSGFFWGAFLVGFEILGDFSLDLDGYVYWLLNVVVGPWRQGRQAECTFSGKSRPTFLGFFSWSEGQLVTDFRFLWMQETVSSLKEPVGIVFSEELTESKSQGTLITISPSLFRSISFLCL